MINIENRMVVEGLREQEERYSTPDWEYFKDEYDDIRTLCDVTECRDCPRMGDDCDGRDVAYYERQGDEYVYYDEYEHEIYREPV